MVSVVVGCRILVLVGGATPVRATVANTGLAAEVVGPAFGELGARDVGLEDIVDGSVVQDNVAGRLGDASFERTRRLLKG